VLGEKPRLSAITGGLGETWELSQNAYKPYPCGVVLHPVIDGCIELGQRHAIAPRDIERIALTVNPLAIARADRKSPRDGLEAKLSLQHGAAVAILHGAAGVKQFTDACVGEPAVAELRGRVELAEDPSTARDAARVALHMKNGRALKVDVPHALGSVQRPMSDADLEAKFRDLAQLGAPGRETRSTIDRVWSLDALADASALARVAVS
jgi:2-methylcitrate dehydratase PrpD